jgi:phosphotransferase system  glucose/maltose/N-acetylglucosamine-specific IIC component
MAKRKEAWRHCWFFLIGVLLYSGVFVLTNRMHIQTFGVFIVGLIGYLICLHEREQKQRWLRPKDVVYVCIGIVFDSLSGGFPFS